MKIKQKKHLKDIRPVKEVDPLLKHLKHEYGFYGLFFKQFDQFMYVGLSKDILKTCTDLLNQSRNPGTRLLAQFMAKHGGKFEKLPFKASQIENTDKNKLLEIIIQYNCKPVELGGAGLNYYNPVTGKRFKKSNI